MRLFGRKKKDREEDEDELDEREESVKKPSARKFKDLNPENSRKRKSPPKPWTKKERFLVGGFFAGMSIVALLLAVSSRNWKLPGLPKLISTNPNDGAIIIEKPVVKVNQKDYSTLKKQIEDLTFNLSGTYGVYVWDLDSNSGFGVNENEVMHAASLIKLPTIAYMYSQADSGKISLSTKYSLKDTDKSPGSGSLINKPAGTQLTYRELVEYMGKQSDNTAYRAATYSILGADNVQAYAKSIGMENTIIDPNVNTTTPYEVGLFFKKLWNGSLVKSSSKEEILDALTDTIYEEWIPASIDNPDIKIAHKYGREVHIINDAGIVEYKNPYVLVIMTDGIDDAEATQNLPKIIKMIHQFVEQ